MNATRGEWLKWVAMGCALVATFYAEYTLAVASGMHPWVSVAVPGALDAYVVRALVRSREVLAAVLAMVAVNVCSHLVTTGVLTVGWPIIAAVSAIAPLVLWRVHALGEPEHVNVSSGTVSVPEHASTPCVTATPGHATSAPARDWDEHADDAVSVAMPDYVPGDWSRARTQDKHGLQNGSRAHKHTPFCVCDACAHVEPVPGWNGHITVDDEPVNVPAPPPETPQARVHARIPEEQARSLALVPPLPNGYVHAELNLSDLEHMGRARVLEAEHRARTGQGVPVRVLKSDLGMGTPRAQRIRTVLDAEHAGTDGGTP